MAEEMYIAKYVRARPVLLLPEPTEDMALSHWSERKQW